MYVRVQFSSSRYRQRVQVLHGIYARLQFLMCAYLGILTSLHLRDHDKIRQAQQEHTHFDV